MTQQKQIYRLNQLTITEVNRLLASIADRFDELEGYRGSPTIRSPMTMPTLLIYAADDDGTLLHGMGDVI
jgi:hypothetical protein